MSIVIKINGLDRTGDIDANTVIKDDRIGGLSTLDFRMTQVGSGILIPEMNEEVELIIDDTTEFKGVIVVIERQVEEGNIARIYIRCNDYAHYLERFIATKRYASTSVEDIIDDLVSEYASDIFTTNNVECDIMVETIIFDKMTLGDCFRKLATLTNYNWYVDYEKDVHFFAKYDNVAPFNITDSNGKYLQGSLSIREDLSQLRNRVIIKGGEIEGDSRTEYLDGDASKVYFKLANKFAEKPTVMVDSVEQTVGVDFLDDVDSFDCLWDFNGRYLKFKVAPDAGADIVEVSGIPLYPIVIQAQDEASINKYGVAEYYKEDLKIKSREEGRQFAVAELEAYAEEIFEGSFQTTTAGLRSGQIININSSLSGVNEDFLIQRVSARLVGKNRIVFSVGLATLKSIGIVDLLINQLLLGNRILEDRGDEVLDKSFFLNENLTIEDVYDSELEATIDESLTIDEDIAINEDEPVFVYAPYIPTGLDDVKVKGLFNRATWH